MSLSLGFGLVSSRSGRRLPITVVGDEGPFEDGDPTTVETPGCTISDGRNSPASVTALVPAAIESVVRRC